MSETVATDILTLQKPFMERLILLVLITGMKGIYIMELSRNQTMSILRLWGHRLWQIKF